MASQFQGKVAIITGSNSGIGEAIAVLFASRGAKVTLCGRDHERLKSVLDKVVKVNGGHQDRVITVQGDVNNVKVRKEIVDKTVETFGRVDILVANAGISSSFHQTLEAATEESYIKHMDTNLKSAIFLIQESVLHLEKSKGNIVIISSNTTTLILPTLTMYAFSKAGLDFLCSSLAIDLGSKSIRVNAVNPGYIRTKIGRDFSSNGNVCAERLEKLGRERQPLKCRSLTVEDVAETMAFLSSDAARCITGEIIRVDCGASYGGYVDANALIQ